MYKRIWLSPPHLGQEEQEFVQQAFQDNWITTSGANIDAFEKDLETFYNNKIHAVALNSGTSAIHLALIAAGIDKDDEVLCQSFTFCGSVNPIIYLHAKPVFIDSEEKTLNMCPIALEIAIKHRIKNGIKPKAIIVVHLYGMPASMNKINQIAKKYNIIVIEDAAEAFGSKYKNNLCGNLSPYGILSFNGNKVITTSAGGALLVNSLKEKDHIIHLATQAKDNFAHYEHTKIGYNYRLSNILAGIGRGQMKILKTHLQKLQDNHDFYLQLFKDSVNITLHTNPNESYCSNHWLNVLFVKPSAKFTNHDIIDHLDSLNIEARLLWKPMHLQPVFQNHLFFGKKVAQKSFQSGLCLPSGSNLTLDDKKRIKEALQPFF